MYNVIYYRTLAYKSHGVLNAYMDAHCSDGKCFSTSKNSWSYVLASETGMDSNVSSGPWVGLSGTAS